MVLTFLVTSWKPLEAQLHPGLNTDVWSVAGNFSTTGLEGGVTYRTVGGDVLLPPNLLPRGTAFRVGAEVGFYSGGQAAGSPRPFQLDGHFLWELGELLFPRLPLGLLASTGGELYYVEEAGTTLRRWEVPLRAGLHYPLPLPADFLLVPGAALHAAWVSEQVSLPDGVLSDRGGHLHMEFGLALRHGEHRALFANVRLGDERFGNRRRLQMGLRSGF
ncbi:MAG: hypothetical protein WEA09_01095 [Gemmatimonadota bacterium]